MPRALWLAGLTLAVGVGMAMSQSSSAQPEKKILRHLVLYQFKPEISAQQVQEVVDAFAALPGQISEIAGFEQGTNVSPEGKSAGLTHAFMVSFRSEKDRDAYLVHPAHDAYVQIVRDRRDKVIVFDYWTTE